VVPLAVLACAGRVAAAETEVREFTIHVDGKPAGQYSMTITKQDNGAESMSGQARVRVKHLLGTYTFTYQGTEQWQGGRLLELRSSTNDNGKRYEVHANAEGQGLRVRVNGGERLARAEVWPTTYWRLADARFHNQAVPVLDADTGKEMTGRLQYLGIVPVTLGQQPHNCYHFRVTGAGPSPIDLWYDGLYRLVRQEFSVEGHRTVFHLTGLRR
jgi:hypothetical protein